MDDIYPGGASPVELTALAGRIVEAERAWLVMPAPDVVAALLATTAATTAATAAAGTGCDVVVGGSRTDGSEPEPLVVFGCGAHLLSRYRLDGQRAYEYLDEIWNTHLDGPR